MWACGFVTAQATGLRGAVVDMVVMRHRPARTANESVSADVADDLERALLRARELIDTTMFEHRRRSSERRVAVESSDDAMLSEMTERVVSQASSVISIIMPEHSTVAATAWAAALSQKPGDRPASVVRLLCAPSVVSSPAVATSGWRARGFDIRVTDGFLQDAVIVDDQCVLVRSELTPTGRQLSVVRESVVVQAFTSMFVGVWRAGSAPVNGVLVDEGTHSGLTWLVLQHLRDGSTDEVASREVQVSLRTYRRRVAEIMRVLGADSRFQAGARAAELGLIATGW